MGVALRTCALLALLSPAVYGQAPAPGTNGRWAILVAGISGDPELGKTFVAQLKQLRTTLEQELKFEHKRVFVLAEDTAADSGVIQFKSTRESLEKVCQEVARGAGKEDLVFVYLIGHGNFEGNVYKLNLVGPDPTAEDLAKMIYSIPARQFVIVNTTTCSGGSLAALSRKGTILITSTKSGFEKNQTHMSEFFVEALGRGTADLDKSGRTSLLEAFNYASQKVAERYSKEGNLQTEHPVIDDNGDHQAHDKPSPENGDGLLARTTYLDAGPGSASGLSPEQQKLALSVQELEREIENLKYRKANMPQEEYEKQLEALLLKLAQVNAKLHNE